MKKIERRKHDDKFEFCFGLFIRYFDKQKNKWRLKINIKRFAIAFILLLCIGWILSATTVYCGLKYLRKYDSISFVQVLKNPFSTDTFRKQMGEAQIAKAYECLKKNDIQGGFLNLLHGVSRNPDDLEARMILSQMYMSLLRDSKRASETLEFRVVKAFEQKNENYLLSSIYIFSTSKDFRSKSVKLLTKCAKNNLINEKKLHSILLSIITHYYKEKKYDDLIEYSRELMSLTNDKTLKSIAAKNSALTLSNISRSDEAMKLLEENNIQTGEVFVAVKIANLIEKENEIDAAKLLKSAIIRATNKTAIYGIHANLAEDFGDNAGKEQSKRMAQLLSGEVVDITLQNIENNSGENLLATVKNYAENNPKKIDKLCKAVVLSKNLELIDFCIKMKISPHLYFTLSLAKIEILLSQKDAREATTLLESLKYSDYVKTNKLEPLLEGFNLITKALSRNDVFNGINTFVISHQASELISLSKMFYKLGLKRESTYLINKTLEKYPTDIRVSAMFAKMAYEENDIQAILEAYQRYSIRIPIYISAKLEDKFKSDKCIFYSQKTLEDLINKSRQAQKKIVEYKKIFGDF